MMIKSTIEEFTNKYGMNFDEFLNDFEKGLSRSALCDKHNVTELPLRKFVYSIGLDFNKTKRALSIKLLKNRLTSNTTKLDKVVKELECELNTTIDTINKVNRKLLITRDENNLLRRQVRTLVRDTRLTDTIIEQFKQATNNIPTIHVEVVAKPKPTLDEGLCVVFSDEHIGEVVDSTDMANNKYNFDIAEKRIKSIVKEVVSNPYQSKKLHMFMLLDSLKGLIHGGAYNNEEGFTTAIMKLIQIYSSVISSLSLVYDEIVVCTTLDNHSRTTDHTSTANKSDNFSVMAFKLIEILLQAKGITNVKFNFSKGNYNLVQVNGANCLLFHGDTVRTYRASSEVQVSKMQDICLQTFKVPAKHFFSGHKHVFEVKANQYGGMSVQNGTVVGSSEYGVNSGFLDIAAIQTIVWINEEGNISMVMPVDVSKVGL